jgi:ElaA protein
MHEEPYKIYYKPFAELSPYELYAIVRLRNEVFVVEQNCVFQDADNKDQDSLHLMIWHKEQLVAYARLLAPGLSFEEMSIGRIISSPAYRGTGAGKLLVSKSIDACYELFGQGPIHIGAQLYLEKFYGSFGFVPVGDVYLEDGIKHIEMIKP